MEPAGFGGGERKTGYGSGEWVGRRVVVLVVRETESEGAEERERREE